MHLPKRVKFFSIRIEELKSLKRLWARKRRKHIKKSSSIWSEINAFGMTQVFCYQSDPPIQFRFDFRSKWLEFKYFLSSFMHLLKQHTMRARVIWLFYFYPPPSKMLSASIWNIPLILYNIICWWNTESFVSTRNGCLTPWKPLHSPQIQEGLPAKNQLFV